MARFSNKKAVVAAKLELSADQLRWRCDAHSFRFETTGEVEPLQEFIGQDRAIKAIEFGLSLNRPGYNIFVSGLTGTGKMSVIKSHLEKLVCGKEEDKLPELFDWCYVYNFSVPDRPRVLRLPKGQSKVFRTEMQQLLDDIRREISRVFSDDDYGAQRKAIADKAQSSRERLYRDVEKEAKAKGCDIRPSSLGIAALPLDKTGKPMTREDYNALSDQDRQAVDDNQSQVVRLIQEAAERVRDVEKAAAEEIAVLDRKITEFTVQPLFARLQNRHSAVPDVRLFLDGALSFVLEHADDLREAGSVEKAGTPGAEAVAVREKELDLAFDVNVLVDNSQTTGLPIIIETNPTYANVFGQLERRAFMGAYFSDHTMLKPGAIALANGGYLIVSARDVLLNPGVWEGLKRTIKTKELRLEDPWELGVGVIVPVGLRPEPVPTEVKVIMVGDAILYQLLSAGDEDFWEMFKIRADFDFEIERSTRNMNAYASLISNICRRDGLCHFDVTGVAKVIEYSARLVADQKKLSSRFGLIRDVLVEADQLTKSRGKTVTTEEEVKQSIEAKAYRSDLVAQRLRELMLDGTIIVDTEGTEIGQINGLSVFEIGDMSFGRPSRITARTFAGRRGVVNIERETRMSGSIHDKGVLILGGYLGWKFAQHGPLSLSASLCFEQSYEGIDGDSASIAELYAILSSLAEVPLRQGIAVTGSVNQKGDVQPIGGVNQKIEGFFDLCNARGLTGDQGVMIPSRNASNLMLREDVVEAVRERRFHVWSVASVEEGIEILTGVPSGAKNGSGRYPAGTLYAKVESRLKELVSSLKSGGEECKESQF